MPELPEVETVVRDLRPLLVSRKLQSLQRSPQSLRRPWQPEWEPQCLGQVVGAIRRRGKWIIIDLTYGTKKPRTTGHLIVHLGMTGQFTIANPASQPRLDHTHFVFELDDHQELRYRDIRRFGSIQWFPLSESIEEHLGENLGPEPEDLVLTQFAAQVQKSQRTLKAILLDQTIVAGVGNIYADEALFHAQLHPETRGTSLTTTDCQRLGQAIQHVIRHAIDSRGSSIRDYVGGSGLRGSYQDEFMAYGRTNEPCRNCETAMMVVRVAGRSSHFCPKCQTRR